MPKETPEKLSAQTAHEKRQPGRTLDWWIEAIAKCGTPLILGILTVIASIKASSIQSTISTATLLSEREKAESDLRASMFKSLIDPFVGSQKGDDIPVDREQLLVELLALNFHEHFEMKPLFQRVDARLTSMKDKSTQEEKRDALKSITRRIVDRQIAMLQKEDVKGGPDRHKALVNTVMIVDEPQDEGQQQLLKRLKEKGGKVYQVGEPIDVAATLDQRHWFTIVIDQADWERQEFMVRVEDSPSRPNGSDAAQARPSNYSIKLTWFDFPLTDNTLFPDGNRFSVILYDVRKEDKLKSITLKFIVFPRNYFTPRERPFDEDEFLKLVGKKT